MNGSKSVSGLRDSREGEKNKAGCANNNGMYEEWLQR